MNDFELLLRDLKAAPEFPKPMSTQEFIDLYYEYYPEEKSVEYKEVSRYTSKQYFENTVPEISEKIGITREGVKKILSKCNGKMARRLFILCFMDKKPESEICEIISRGDDAVRKEIKCMFI